MKPVEEDRHRMAAASHAGEQRLGYANALLPDLRACPEREELVGHLHVLDQCRVRLVLGAVIIARYHGLGGLEEGLNGLPTVRRHRLWEPKVVEERGVEGAHDEDALAVLGDRGVNGRI